jgi:hypothetical protein
VNKSSSPIALAVLVSAFAAGCKKDEPPPPVGGEPAGATPVAPGARPSTPLPSTGTLANFEGELGLSVRTPSVKDAQTMTLFVKGQRLRFDIPAGLDHDPQLGRSPHITLDLGLKRMTAVVDERKTAITFSLDAMEQMQKTMAAQRPQAATEPPKIEKTGRKATIAGYPCEDWELSSKNGEKATVCMSNEAAPWAALPTSAMDANKAWAREIFDGQHLPLRIVTSSPQGETRLEVTKIEKKPVADSVFEAPAGYQVMDMSAFAKQMMDSAAAGQTAAGQLPPGQIPAGANVPPATRAMIEQLKKRAEAAQKKAQ